jgi:hypothetical protein
LNFFSLILTNTISAQDLFSWNADDVSEKKVMEDVEHLNYLLQNLVDNALDAVSSKKYQDTTKSKLGKDGFESKISETNHLSPLGMRCASLTEKIVSGGNYYHPSRAEQSLLDDALLRDTLCQLLYRTYFAGTYFFGLSENEESVLNTLFETIQSQGKVLQSNKYTMIISLIHSLKNPGWLHSVGVQ